MRTLAVDVGSSAVKAAIFDDGTRRGEITRQAVTMHYEGRRAELATEPLWAALVGAIQALDPGLRRGVDRLALDALCPGLVLMRRHAGRWQALTPAITHQDRRSSDQAAAIEARIGRKTHLRLVGCRPFPGGIASSSLLWLAEHQPSLLAEADIIGQLTTYLIACLTDEPVMDPGNASFTGLFETFTAGGANRWSPELCAAVGVKPSRLPRVQDGTAIAGRLRPAVAATLGLAESVEVLTGVIDTSAAILADTTGPAGLPAVGQLIHSIGTTDVLAAVTDRPRVGRRVLTRALGVGPLWLSVSTVAAGGGSLSWAAAQLFADYDPARFAHLVAELARDPQPSPVQFRPYLAGDRMSLTPKTAAFSGLTMAHGRREMLKAILDAWCQLSAAGLRRLARRVDLLPRVLVTGGASAVAASLHAQWPGPWQFVNVGEATLTGLAHLARLGLSVSPSALATPPLSSESPTP